jgi:ArsR family transcriptional regulator, arsenate/arsenite/antimonite-responsive transcriptional repressor
VNENEVVGALSALAQPVRLQVLRALVAAGERGLTPSTMAEGLGVPQNTLSFHLKELARSGLVTQQRASRHIVYRAAGERMDALLGYLGGECRAGRRRAKRP